MQFPSWIVGAKGQTKDVIKEDGRPGDDKGVGEATFVSGAGGTPRARKGEATPPTQKRVQMVTAAELARPDIAWPTILLFSAGVIAFVLPIILTLDSPSWKTIPLSTVATFWLFTPMHDAAHRSVSKYRWINELVGYTCGVVFTAPFRAFRFLHLEHHKHTNDAKKDPDMWISGMGPAWIRPLFWSTQVPHYFYFYICSMPIRPLNEVIETVSLILAIIAWVAWLINNGYGSNLLYCYLYPRLLADTCLAYSFDYAPHRPHSHTRETNIYKSTSVISGFFDPKEGLDLRYVLLFQNFHNIHHLYPTIPWYKYADIWYNHYDQLRELGTPMTNWIGPIKSI